MVCANTQAAALRSAVSSVSIRHTSRAGVAVQQARKTHGLTFAYVDAFEAEAERLIQTEMSSGQFDQLITSTFGPPPAADATSRTRDAYRRRTDRLRWLFDDADTQQLIRGTAWAGYQAVAEYVDHYAPISHARTPMPPVRPDYSRATSRRRPKNSPGPQFPEADRNVVLCPALLPREGRALLRSPQVQLFGK